MTAAEDILRAADGAAKKGRWLRAAFFYQQAYAINAAPELLEAQALAYFRAGHFARALELFLQAARLNPRPGTAFNAGAAAEQLGLHGAAHDLYQEAIASNPAEVPAALGVARILSQRGDHANGLRILLKARCASHPVDVDVAIMNTLHRLGRSRDSMAVYCLIHGLTDPIPEPPRAIQSLHSALWTVMSRRSMSFGAGGFYQSMLPLHIPGMRPTERRLAAYEVHRWVDRTSHALDIGCNHGFIALSLASICREVTGFDSDQQLVECANIAKRWMRAKNVTFKHSTAFELDGEFDFLLSCAVHQWIGADLSYYTQWLRNRLRVGGYVLFESNDIDNHDRDFDDKASYLRDQIGEIVHAVSDYDDRFYRRKAVVIRRVR